MIQLLNVPDALFCTFHRAWTACVGLPLYDKASWRILERQVVAAGSKPNEDRTVALLLTIESLLTRQGGVYSQT
jgi:hypothetical protein